MSMKQNDHYRETCLDAFDEALKETIKRERDHQNKLPWYSDQDQDNGWINELLKYAHKQ
jgi:hypothetical protein